MDHTPTPRTPNTLILSDCVPNPAGTARQSRAWQLLRHAAKTRGVHLICTHDAPTNLSHWRAARAQVEHMVIETVPLRHRLLAHALRPFHRAAADRIRRRAPLVEARKTGVLDGSYDTILCTHPDLWVHAQHIPAAVRVCDTAVVDATVSGANNEAHDQATRRAQPQWDVLLSRTATTTEKRRQEPARVVAAPYAVDTDYFAAIRWESIEHRRARAPRRIVLHADWERPDSLKHERWFNRIVRPQVLRHDASVSFATTRPPCCADPAGTLCTATLVVLCTAEPDRFARSSLLQAMAAQRPTITGSTVAKRLGAHDGQHVLCTNTEAGLIIACKRLLLDTHLRLHLSQSAATLASRHAVFGHGTGELSELFDHRPTTAPSLAQAA